MKHLPRPLVRKAPQAQRGFVLIAGMIFLVVITLLAVSMFRGSGLQERIANNTRDKQRAFEVAQTALQYGEYWLSQGNAGSATSCSSLGTVDASVTANVQVCTAALGSNLLTPSSWPAQFQYKPAAMNVTAGGGIDSTSGDIKYQGTPGFYINYLGNKGANTYYQVSAYGYGGSAADSGSTDPSSTVSIVQSTYQIQSAIKNLDPTSGG